MSETPIENTAAEIIALLKETIRPDLQALDAELLALRAQLAQREQEVTALRAQLAKPAWRMAERAKGLALNLHARFDWRERIGCLIDHAQRLGPERFKEAVT